MAFEEIIVSNAVSSTAAVTAVGPLAAAPGGREREREDRVR